MTFKIFLLKKPSILSHEFFSLICKKYLQYESGVKETRLGEFHGRVFAENKKGANVMDKF